ncbi:MAG: putative Ig domain-containing protein, partial [Bacteroidota bacterium]
SNSFAYYVEARDASKKARTNYILVFIQVVTQDRVVIVSEPNRHGRVGQAYTYQPKAFSTDSTAQLKWLLPGKPTGMTIDSISGLVQWTPTVKGWFKVVLAVVSNKGAKAAQEFQIAIAGGFGVVQGVVTDTLGNPVLAVVKLFKRDISTPFEYRMVTDSAGAYSFADVDVGSYIAYAAPILGDYIPQWYYDKNRPDQATPIVVADSSTVTANFRLRSRSATTPMWNITGKVSDTLNAKIQGALVVFAKAEFILNSAKHLGASEQQSENFREIFKDLLRFGAHSVAGNFQLVFRTVTDTGGRYSIRLPQGAYIGISFAQGFRKMFYNNKTDLLSADLLRLSKDTANINFSLIPLPAF